MEVKTALVTGANTGIGKEIALLFASKGIKVFIASRSYERTIPVLQTIEERHGPQQCEWISLELDSLNSVNRCAEVFLEKNLPLNYLVNNAGFAGSKGLTKEGFELAFGTNYFGHYVLTNRLSYALIRSKNARVINVSSKIHGSVKRLDFSSFRKKTKSFSGISEYAVSKLANILFTIELHRRYSKLGVFSFAVHPGLVDTDIWRTLPFFLRPILRLKGMLSAEEGAKNVMYCALDVSNIYSGQYFSKCQPSRPSSLASNKKLATKLWEHSDLWMKQYVKKKFKS